MSDDSLMEAAAAVAKRHQVEDYNALGKWLVEHPDYNPDETHADSEYHPLGASYA